MGQKIISARVEELRSAIPDMRAGDRVILSGEVYTARDAAHGELVRLLERGEALPFDPRGAVIYYAGPTPGVGGRVVGACGPTTSGRMDGFAPRLYDLGVLATIGKGERCGAARDAIVRNGAVYLCAVGGAGAIIARHVTEAVEIAFPELGCESVKRLTVRELPLTVGIDCYGGDLFAIGRDRYKKVEKIVPNY